MIETFFDVEALPREDLQSRVFRISGKGVANLTHNFFKYPCKFIPQIPAWAIEKFLDGTEGKTVYDPFAGSGTTLVEAVLRGHTAVGADIDPFSRLLTKVKTTQLSDFELDSLRAKIYQVARDEIENDLDTWIPSLPNIELFFTSGSIYELATIRKRVMAVAEKNVQDFLLVIFASVIRSASLADEVSPKPYVSKKHPKRPKNAFAEFRKKAESSLERIAEFSSSAEGNLKVLETDARNSQLQLESVDLAITSPPYINAFDYVRTLKFENYWLGLVDDDSIAQLRVGSIGTETLKLLNREEALGDSLATLVTKIGERDLRRSQVVIQYFQAMKKNFDSTFSLLKRGSKYVVVVADSEIRGVVVPTGKLLTEIALKCGFVLDFEFEYLIQNRYLRIPRGDNGGFMKTDRVLVFEKR